MNILSVAFIVFILNLPFGYWRANVRKFSLAWFLSIHAPVPLVIAIRILSGLGWQFITFPIMITAFFGGQFVGSWLHRMRSTRSGVRVSSCLVWDLLSNDQKS
ncbi:MAG TPA: hypothetical protein VEM40_14285 [Nitrospirota bacterium]|nr:hypothetical protein [Nitrospirota bacterium]